MTTYRNELSQAIDNQYNCRSLARQFYISLNPSDEYKLNNELYNNIITILKQKCNIEVNVKTLSINISDIDIQKSRNKIDKLHKIVRSILANFVCNNCTDNNVIQYFNNPLNLIFDSFIVGNSIKFIL